jgi:hypothetical protein
MLAGLLNPPAAWGELLPELQQLARQAGDGSPAGRIAAELLSDWQVPVQGDAEAIGRWLRATVEQLAMPLEAKLARALPAPDGEPARGSAPLGSSAPDRTPSADAATPDRAAAASSLAQARADDAPSRDVRARLDLLSQTLPFEARRDDGGLGHALQRIQATIQSEQILNGSSVERAEPRFFAVTVPTVLHQQPGTLQIRVRERDAQPRRQGEAARPDIVQLKLSLPGLGDLGVNLTVGQQSVACHFAAGSRFAEALLNASSGELVGRLQRLGFAHPAVDVAHEAPEPIAPAQATAPRVGHVDLSA